MEKPRAFQFNGEEVTLRDSVEVCAVGIAESIFKKEKRLEEILQECRILDSLSSALVAIK